MKEIVEPTEKTEIRNLYVALTQDEFNVRATEYAKLDDTVASLEGEAKRVADDFKKRIGGMESDRRRMGRVIQERQELRDVQCTWHADWASKSMILRRDDTSEVIHARTMTPDEVQLSFDVTPKNRRLPKKRKDSDEAEDADESAPTDQQ